MFKKSFHILITIGTDILFLSLRFSLAVIMFVGLDMSRYLVASFGISTT